MQRITRARTSEGPSQTPQQVASNTSAPHRDGTPARGQSAGTLGLLSGLLRRLPGNRARRRASPAGTETFSDRPEIAGRLRPRGAGTPMVLDEELVDALLPAALPQFDSSERARFPFTATTDSPQLLNAPSAARPMLVGAQLQRSTQLRSYENALAQWRDERSADLRSWHDAWFDASIGLTTEITPRNALQITVGLLADAARPDAELLSIDTTPLPQFPEQTTFRLSHLQTMDITAAGLQALPETMHELRNLQSLSLHNNPIQKLPASIANMIQLRELCITSSPHLSQLPCLATSNASGEPEGLINLSTLKLSRTGLRSLPESIKHLKKLQHLEASRSQLNALPVGIHDLPMLQTLNLRGCEQLRCYPPIFAGRAPLKKLNLRDCINLRSLPADIHKLAQLEELDLRGCRNLKNLPSSITKLPATCRIHVPPHLREKLSELRPAQTPSASDLNYAKNIIENIAHDLLDLVLQERNPFTEGAPFYPRGKRPAGTPATLGQVPALKTLLDESKGERWHEILEFVNPGPEFDPEIYRTEEEFDDARTEWESDKNANLSDVIYQYDSEINVQNLCKAVQMWKLREMLLAKHPVYEEYFPLVATHIPDDATENTQPAEAHQGSLHADMTPPAST
ncbi:hypothetical protein VB151_03070 [Xanthomonas fragariae]|nr:hypothetical protein [Xanthomonas fragariae]MBL9197817.1 hypothetical protein [Xanthomonas fragariae]MBL9219923.1 hypothetical protein [Xanthomonas fragariae]MDM7571420.1 hypothetical protein [Xanthomonas fragariae]MDM7580730.1 hypothetical protein [Xanthomonas fragariae]MEA5173001.1 hypothetical protein [Xanthomonas fragariae]